MLSIFCLDAQVVVVSFVYLRAVQSCFLFTLFLLCVLVSFIAKQNGEVSNDDAMPTVLFLKFNGACFWILGSLRNKHKIKIYTYLTPKLIRKTFLNKETNYVKNVTHTPWRTWVKIYIIQNSRSISVFFLFSEYPPDIIKHSAQRARIIYSY